MVEAAIVFPVVILALISVIYIIINMYTGVAVTSRIHIALREAEGIHSNTIEYISADKRDFPEDKYGRRAYEETIEIGEKQGFFNKELHGECIQGAIGKGLISALYIRKYKGEIKIIDEEKRIRWLDCANLKKKEEAP